MLYLSPVAGLLAVGLVLVLAGLGMALVWRWPWPLLVLVLAPLPSVLMHPGPISVGRLVLYAGAAGAVLLGRRIGPGRLQLALWPAALGWLPVVVLWQIGTWPDNRNLIAFWGTVFTLSATGPLLVLLALATISLGGRAAMVGLLAGLLVRYNRWRWWYVLLILPAGAALYAMRSHTVLNRLVYWYGGWVGWLSAPWLGVGPGGLRKFITEPGTSVAQVHAHNSTLTWLAETGLIGLALAGLGLIGLAAYSRPTLWQRGLLVAIIIQCTVDDLIWWPGPLIMAGLLVGSTMKGDLPYGYHQISSQFRQKCREIWPAASQQTQNKTPPITAPGQQK